MERDIRHFDMFGVVLKDVPGPDLGFLLLKCPGVAESRPNVRQDDEVCAFVLFVDICSFCVWFEAQCFFLVVFSYPDHCFFLRFQWCALQTTIMWYLRGRHTVWI